MENMGNTICPLEEELFCYVCERISKDFGM